MATSDNDDVYIVIGQFMDCLMLSFFTRNVFETYNIVMFTQVQNWWIDSAM